MQWWCIVVNLGCGDDCVYVLGDDGDVFYGDVVMVVQVCDEVVQVMYQCVEVGCIVVCIR